MRISKLNLYLKPTLLVQVLMAFSGCSSISSALAENLSIQSTNLALQNSLIRSANLGNVSSQGLFKQSAIQGGEYNTISVAATGVSVSASNINNTATPINRSESNIISSMNITTQNSGSITANGTFQGGNIMGAHNGMSVQAAGSSVSLSNIKH